MSLPERQNILGVNVSAIDLNEAVDIVVEAAHENRPLGVSALAVHGLVTAADDPPLRYRLNSLELVVPDGQPLRWALRLQHHVRLADKVPGPDLMYSICQRAASEGLGVFLFGSTPETLKRLGERLLMSIPGLEISGAQASRFRAASPSERDEDIETILRSGASVVFVGLGCPRQEIWTYENRVDLSMPVLGVGAAFDYHAGFLRRAPHWMRRTGLEWVYRLVQEPRRLARRYFSTNPRFLLLFAQQLSGLRDFNTRSPSGPPKQVRPG